MPVETKSRYLDLDRDFSICQDFWAWSLKKVLKKSRLCREILKVSICLDNLDKYLDKDKSRPKNLDFKNLDREKKKVDLDRRENLDNLKKFVSTRGTFSISISICLDVETTNLNFMALINAEV